VTFDPWPDEADKCDAKETVAEGEGQMPEGIGDGESAAPMGELVMAESVSTVAASQSDESAGEGGPASGSPEVQTMSRAADEGADQMAADTSMDGQIASGEGERDTAVSDYLTATGGLGGIVARSQSLAAGVSFPAAKGAQQAEARQAVIAATQDFMARSAAQIAAAVAFAQDQLPSMLRDVAESTKATIQDNIETEKATISDRIAQARAQARSGAAAARAHVNAEYANSAAQIEASTLAAITALDDTYITSVDLTDEMETDGLDDVNERFATGRTDHEAKGPVYADRAIARGQEHADEYERCKRRPGLIMTTTASGMAA
jgi:flagellar biosynthesis/type III secretory pathway protein FliH